MGKRALAMILGLCAAGLMSTGASTALGAWPETRPTSHPATLPTLDSVVKLPRISLKTQGLTAKEAFELLSKETGVPIFSRKWESRAVMPGHNPGEKDKAVEFEEDVWDYAFKRAMNFDIENASFWEAACRIADYSGIGIESARSGTVVLTRRDRDDIVGLGKRVFLDHALIWMRDGDISRINSLSYNEDPGKMDRVHVSNSLLVHMALDPRIRVVSEVFATWEGALGGDGRPIEPIVLQDENEEWELGLFSSLKDEIRLHDFDTIDAEFDFHLRDWPTKEISVFRGWFEMDVATETKSVEMPVDQLGYAKKEGDWRVKLEDFDYSGTDKGPRLNNILVGLEPQSAGMVVPETILKLARVYDERGVGLGLDQSSEGKQTMGGGLRQKLEITSYSMDGGRFKPAKMVVEVPLGIRRVVVPFEMRNLEWPEVKTRIWPRLHLTPSTQSVEEEEETP